MNFTPKTVNYFTPSPTRFGGGGVVATIFRDLHNRTTLAGGGGVVGEFFSLAPRKDQSDFPQFREIFDISHSKNVTTLIHCRKKHLQKVWPPLATPLLLFLK